LDVFTLDLPTWTFKIWIFESYCEIWTFYNYIIVIFIKQSLQILVWFLLQCQIITTHMKLPYCVYTVIPSAMLVHVGTIVATILVKTKRESNTDDHFLYPYVSMVLEICYFDLRVNMAWTTLNYNYRYSQVHKESRWGQVAGCIVMALISNSGLTTEKEIYTYITSHFPLE
jgi:hypothetical protein